MAEMSESDIGGFMNDQCRLAEMQFNKKTISLLSNLYRIFPTDAKLRFLLEETIRKSNNPEERGIPAVLFWDAISKRVPPDDNTIGMLINEKSVAVLNNPEHIPLFGPLNMKDKYENLTDKNRDLLWKMLQQMVVCSSRAVALQCTTPENIMDILSESNISGMIQQMIPKMGNISDVSISNVGQLLGDMDGKSVEDLRNKCSGIEGRIRTHVDSVKKELANKKINKR
jgi:hypothetical protein